MKTGDKVRLTPCSGTFSNWQGEIGTILDLVSRDWGEYASVLYDNYRSMGSMTYRVQDLEVIS